MPACNFKHIKLGADSCENDYSGVGDRVYYGLRSYLDPKPGLSDYISGKNEFNADAFEDLQGHLYCIDIKSDSGQVTAESTETADGFKTVGTFIVNKNLDAAAAAIRSCKLSDLVWFIPDNKGKYYVLYSQNKKVVLTSTFDSGTTYDSDHGHTVTLTVAPCEFPVSKWAPSSSSSSGETLDDWLVEEN